MLQDCLNAPVHRECKRDERGGDEIPCGVVIKLNLDRSMSHQKQLINTFNSLPSHLLIPPQHLLYPAIKADRSWPQWQKEGVCRLYQITVHLRQTNHRLPSRPTHLDHPFPPDGPLSARRQTLRRLSWTLPLLSSCALRRHSITPSQMRMRGTVSRQPDPAGEGMLTRLYLSRRGATRMISGVLRVNVT
jgi:hypothetical protein